MKKMIKKKSHSRKHKSLSKKDIFLNTNNNDTPRKHNKKHSVKHSVKHHAVQHHMPHHTAHHTVRRIPHHQTEHHHTTHHKTLSHHETERHHTVRHKSLKSIPMENTKKSKKKLSYINEIITTKEIRKFDVNKVFSLMKIIPKFIKFYNSLSRDEIMAIKYYKGVGSTLQTYYFTTDPKDIKIQFPFSYGEEELLRKDIMGDSANNLLKLIPSLDIKDINKYLKSTITTRLTLLNRLNNIYLREDCPKLSGNEILFRGMGMPEKWSNKKEGDTIRFDNFISTTIDRSIAEAYAQMNMSNNYSLFVLLDLKNIPYIYMPQTKRYKDYDFSKFMLKQNIGADLGEFTLPRGLEFKILKIDKKKIKEFIWRDNKKIFEELNNILISKGFFTEENSEITKEQKDKYKEDIENYIFGTINVYYCTLVNWNQMDEVEYDKLFAEAEIVVNKNNLESWEYRI